MVFHFFNFPSDLWEDLDLDLEPLSRPLAIRLRGILIFRTLILQVQSRWR